MAKRGDKKTSDKKTKDAQNLPVEQKNLPVTEIREIVPDMRGGIKHLTKKEMDFLQHYASELNKAAAAKAAGYNSSWDPMQSEAIVAEMERIEKAFFYGMRMNANFAGGEHMRLMEKFERKYDAMDHENQAKMASVLAKMSETTLKATGKIGGDGKGGQAVQVVINMDMGLEK